MTGARRARRVLHVHSGNLYGGIETMLATLARCRDAVSGLEPSFALCFPGRLAEELAAAGVPPADLGPARSRFPWTGARARRRLAHLLARGGFDAAVLHSSWSLAVLGPAVAAAGTPLVAWHHAPPSGHWLERRARKVTPRLAIANSGFTAAAVEEANPGTAVTVIHPPLAVAGAPPPPDPAARAALRSALGATPEEAVIVQVSRLEPWKGHELLLAALARLPPELAWRAWIVGGAGRPAERRFARELAEKAAAEGVAGRISWLGERRDVAQLLAAADLFCQPNLAPEPFGLAFVEALAAGLPVLATAAGGAREIVDPSCGVLVPLDRPDRLAPALAALLADPGYRRRLGAAGPARARALCDPADQIGRLAAALTALGEEPG